MTKETKTEKYIRLCKETTKFYNSQTPEDWQDEDKKNKWSDMKDKCDDLLSSMTPEEGIEAIESRVDIDDYIKANLIKQKRTVKEMTTEPGSKQEEYDHQLDFWINETISNIGTDKIRIPVERFIELTKIKADFRQTHETELGRKYVNQCGKLYTCDIKDKDFQEIFESIFAWAQRQIYSVGLNKQEKWSPKNTYEYACHFITQYYDIHTIRGEKLEMWITIDDIEQPNAENYVKEMCRLLYGSNYSKGIAQQVIDKIAVDTLIDAKQYFKPADPRYVAVKNGVLDIMSYSIISKPKDIRFFSRIETIYNNNAKCPAFIEHLDQVLIDQTDKNAIQEFFGYTLVRHHKIEKAFVWLGGGRNGKGKTAEAMIKMIGQQNNVNIPMSSVESYPFAMAGLFGKHLNCIAEFEQEQIKSTARFKNLTGNDEVTAPRKHISEITFKSYAKWLILANELPNVKDLTVAFFNRISIIQFPYTFMAKPDYDLLSEEEIAARNIKVADPSKVEKITTQEELEGLLVWSLEGLKRLMVNKGFTTSKSDKDVQRIWKQSSNNFSTFAEEYLTQDWDKWVSKRQMKYVYMMYCKRYSLKPVTDKKVTFFLSNDIGLQVTQKMNAETNYDKLYVWDGIRFGDKAKELIEWGKRNGFDEPVILVATKPPMQKGDEDIDKYISGLK